MENGLTEKQLKLIDNMMKKNPEFADEADRMSTDQMEDRIVRLSADINEAEVALEENQAYQMLLEQVKQFKQPFTDAKKELSNKIKYLMIKIQEKGGSPNTNPRIPRV